MEIEPDQRSIQSITGYCNIGDFFTDFDTYDPNEEIMQKHEQALFLRLSFDEATGIWYDKKSTKIKGESDANTSGSIYFAGDSSVRDSDRPDKHSVGASRGSDVG